MSSVPQDPRLQLSVPQDIRLQLAEKAADATLGWTFKQTAEVVIPFVTLLMCGAYIGYQVGWAEPARAKEWKESDIRHNEHVETIAGNFASTMEKAIDHGEKRADKQEKLFRELFVRPAQVGAADVDSHESDSTEHADAAGTHHGPQ